MRNLVNLCYLCLANSCKVELPTDTCVSVWGVARRRTQDLAAIGGGPVRLRGVNLDELTGPIDKGVDKNQDGATEKDIVFFQYRSGRPNNTRDFISSSR